MQIVSVEKICAQKFCRCPAQEFQLFVYSKLYSNICARHRNFSYLYSKFQFRLFLHLICVSKKLCQEILLVLVLGSIYVSKKLCQEFQLLLVLETICVSKILWQEILLVLVLEIICVSKKLCQEFQLVLVLETICVSKILCRKYCQCQCQCQCQKQIVLAKNCVRNLYSHFAKMQILIFMIYKYGHGCQKKADFADFADLQSVGITHVNLE